MKPKKLFYLIVGIILLVLTVCTKPEAKKDIALDLDLSRPLVESKAGNQFLAVNAGGEWTLELVFEGKEKDWARLSTLSGKESNSAIILSWDANNSSEQRVCKITLKADYEKTINFIQEGSGENSVPKWLELPNTNNAELLFVSHDMTTTSGKKTRNYSYLYDKEAMLSLWVAYPLNKDLLTGDSGRTDEWGYDPKIPKDNQQELYRGYKGGYDRGHQIPSADRQTKEANRQTFYFTNMTPQLGSLNQKQWASLEGRVRTWAEQCDTLYVVTGADFRKANKYAEDNLGRQISVPNAYYKALLAYKQSSKKYYGIAFYYEHRAYNNDVMNQALTIDALEEKLGVDFFVNLPIIAGLDVANKVEATIDSWWK